MSRISAVALFACCLLAGGPRRATSEGEAIGALIPRAPARAPLAAHLTFSHPASRLGWGSFDLAAAPEVDAIEVRITLGAPVRTSRWATCPALSLRSGAEERQVPLRHIEVSMNDGVYEAVTGRVSIEHLRGVAGGAHVEAEVCGDRLLLPAPAGRALSEFVRDFDDRALYDGPPPPPPPPALAPDGEWTDESPPPDSAPA